MGMFNEILPLREQAAIRDRWLKTRLDTIVPELLARENIDMWIIICREYNEDPVLMSLLPATSMSARRRTILGLHADCNRGRALNAVSLWI